MTNPTITLTFSPPDLPDRFANYGNELDEEVRQAHRDTLAILHGEVPPYAPEPPGSTYIRTGDLGAGIGSGMGGGIVGTPSIFKTQRLGEAVYESEFGSSVPTYNEYVIGEGTQAAVHRGRWWTIRTIADKAMVKINQRWEKMTDNLAKYLNG